MAWFLVGGILPATLHGQPATGRPSDDGRSVQPPIAVNGQPFGILMAEFRLPPGLARDLASAGKDVAEPRVMLEESENRIFYPVTSIRWTEITQQPAPPPGGRIGRPGGIIDRIRSAVRGESETRRVPVAIRVTALYRGDQPLRLQLVGDIEQQFRVETDSVTDEEFARIQRQWWTHYTSAASEQIAGNDFPTLIHKYLTFMLGNRLDLPWVDLDPPEAENDSSSSPGELEQPLETLELLAAIEPMRERILAEVMRGPPDRGGQEQPLPPEPQWEEPVMPPSASEVAIEASAQRVPPECFYLRFGSFNNYLWFQDLSQRFGGDISQAVVLRGFNYEATQRMERMLATKMTTIARMFGDRIIGDMSLLGSDLYLREGASLGVLFQASNPGLLQSSLQSDRRSVASEHADATLTTIELVGREVSLLSTPDNRIRSFYVRDGDFILITSSRTLARRFLEVGQGAASLADTETFRWARTWMPVENDYSVFAYFSPDFFHRLVSPQYQIELRRRLEAVAHLEMAAVASQAAQAEGLSLRSVEDLKAEGFLPKWFDERPDGARVLKTTTESHLSDNGDNREHSGAERIRWFDSKRGGRGSFLPIADVRIDSVTPAEAQQYREVAEFYQEQWQTMDPLLFGLRRFQSDQQTTERVTFEAYVAPFDASKYGWLSRQLAEPTPIELHLPADDVASVQLHVRGDGLIPARFGNYHLFGGIKDLYPPSRSESSGLLKTLQLLRSTPAYIGAWPKPALIEHLPLGLGASLAQPDFAGYSRMIGGLWRWQDDQFSLLSFNRQIIDDAIPQLDVVETEDMAQARLQVADLSGTQIASWVNDQWHARGLRASRGNARFLDAIHQQLKVAGDDCLNVAQSLLDVRLQCPLGGEYHFQELPTNGGGWWQSTAWPGSQSTTTRSQAPADYQAPWIEWFRGSRVHVTQMPTSLAAVGELQLDLPPIRNRQTKSQEEKLPSMNFDVFQLPSKLFGGGENETDEDAQDTPQRRSF